MAPQMCRSTNRQVDPEVWFRIVHLAQNGLNSAPMAAYREQMVEIALGPKGPFENGNIGALKRRVSTDRVVSAVPLGRGMPKPPKEPRTPRVVELLRKAIEWQSLLESGKAINQAYIACQEGISRARVTQVMGMLRLAPEIQKMILTPSGSPHHRPVTERGLRPIASIVDHGDQVINFQELLI